MAITQSLDQVKTNLSQATSVYVLLPQNPTVDMVAGGLALYLTLKENNIQVSIASPSPMRVEFSRLVGVDKISQKIGNRNLVISLKSPQGSIEKVSANEKGDTFELVIIPKAGKKAPQKDEITYTYAGAEAELLFIVGANALESLGDIYQTEKKLFTSAHTVSINKMLAKPIAQTTVTDPEASSISEIINQLIEQLGFSIKDDIASNILAGIDSATNRFSSPVTSPNAFSLAGKLMAAGGKRQPIIPTPTPEKQFPQTHARTAFPQAPQPNILQPMSPQVSAQTAPTSPGVLDSAPVTPQPTNQPPLPASTAAAPDSSDTPPQDWLEPKIFSGSTKV